VRRFPVGRLPQHVTPSWDLRRLWVANDESNTLTPIDPATGHVGRPVPVADPYNPYFTPDGRRAIVVAERLGRLDFHEPRSMRPRHALAVPCPGVDHLDFSADGRFLLASCECGASLIRVDAAAERVTGILALRPGPPSLWSGLRFEFREGCAEPRCLHHRHLELVGVGDGPEVAELVVDAVPIGGGERGPVADPRQGGDIAVDPGRVPGRRVHEQLTGPELEAGQLDLRYRPVPPLKVETGVGNLKSRLGGLLAVTCANRCDQCVESLAHPRAEPLRQLARSEGIPGAGHGLDARRRPPPVAGPDGVHDLVGVP